MRKSWLIGMLACLAMAAPASAQIRTVDPNDAIDGDLATSPAQNPDPRGTTPYSSETPYNAAPQDESGYPEVEQPAPAPDPYAPAQPQPQQDMPAPAAPRTDTVSPVGPTPQETQAQAETYARDDLIGAAEGLFGKGAAGLADIIQDILSDQGEPNAYIAGREASGAFIVGLRYGSGIMHHRIEGERPVYWTGPSVGFDVGGDAAKVFVLVYNLYDSQELYKRFPQAEGRVYFVGGFSASYLRAGDVVLIPVRLGVGWRLGANIGYMKFTEKQNWMPF